MKKELTFVIEESPEGGYSARALRESIHTEADTEEQLKQNIKEAVACHFDEEIAFCKRCVYQFMKLPRDVSASDLLKALAKLGYVKTRQKSSHIRL